MDWLWLVPILPLAGALLLAVFGGFMPRRTAGAIGCLSVGLSSIISLIIARNYLNAPPQGGVFHQALYEWMRVGSLRIPMGLYLDQLSLVMMCVITFVGLLIHLYSAEYMYHEEGYSRFFSYMNLFVGSMLILVLADNFLSLYFGWEGVGLCSYLLIGFWYKERANGLAAQKAFIITRIGDTALAIGLFLLFTRFGTLDIQETMRAMSLGGADIQGLATIVALLILGGAIGKSAQIPLHTWLPDAMAGPSPVSALIHAATMVTAGVYLIARTHALFTLSPSAMLAVAVIGAVTACYGGFCALAQRDIKRVLAYSTISQIGYMFLALGVGAWWAAIFHFMTHAFFKALLFLSAGIVVQALEEERDIYKMGGMLRKLPIAGWTFLIGAASLSALPVVTAGFYSKDAILWASWISPYGSPLLWAAGILAALLTGIYIFRVFFIVFWGKSERGIEKQPGLLVNFPVILLAIFSIIAGFVGLPQILGGSNPFGHFMSGLFGHESATAVSNERAFLIISAVISLSGIIIAYLVFMRHKEGAAAFGRSTMFDSAKRLSLAGFGFDLFYDRLLVRPFIFLTRLNRHDFVDTFFAALAIIAALCNMALSATQSGRVRNYATGILLGAVLVTAILLLR
jgi:NADH-quinone oxidoreductase subunit L